MADSSSTTPVGPGSSSLHDRVRSHPRSLVFEGEDERKTKRRWTKLRDAVARHRDAMVSDITSVAQAKDFDDATTVERKRVATCCGVSGFTLAGLLFATLFFLFALERVGIWSLGRRAVRTEALSLQGKLLDAAMHWQVCRNRPWTKRKPALTASVPIRWVLRCTTRGARSHLQAIGPQTIPPGRAASRVYVYSYATSRVAASCVCSPRSSRRRARAEPTARGQRL